MLTGTDRTRQGGAERLEVALDAPLPDRVAVGRGSAIVVAGRAFHPDGPVSRLAVVADGERRPVLAERMPPAGGFTPLDRWWALVELPATAGRRELALGLRGRVGRREAVADLGTVVLEPGGRDGPAASADGDLVAICMATYNPPADLFERQIESIRAQTHERWLCVISDDGSDPAHREAMRALLAGDDRFRLVESDERLGFYGNFERALRLAPPEAPLVALCDQDDRWYPDKLEALVARIEPGVQLAYSDMRIVTRDGELVSDTYWSYRRTNHTNLASLLIANTITGAASLLRREVLDRALPFPPPQGSAFHDHWIACTALALGRVAYVERPLYEYVQHLDAALGHTSANATGVRRRAEGGRLGGLRSDVNRLRMQKLDLGLRAFYSDVYLWIALVARVLELRCGDAMSASKRRATRRVRRSARPLGMAWLALRSLRPLYGANETFGRERPLLLALAWSRLSPSYARLRGYVHGRRGRGGRRRLAGSGTRSVGQRIGIGGRRRAARARGGEDGGAWLEPVLVDYFTRDGSTLMMRLLASSPEIAVDRKHPYERKYFAYLWRWSRLLDRADWPVDDWTPRDMASILLERDAALMGPPPWLPRALIEPGPGDEPMSRRCFELAWAEFSRRAAERTRADLGSDARVRFYAEKHLNTWRLDLDELPALRIVALLRDPRDTYVSMDAFNRMRGTQGFGRQRAGTEREYLEGVIARQRERMRWIIGLGDDGPVPVVRYEDLILDLPGVAARLGERLGVALDADEVARDRRDRKRHVTSASPEESIGRWRREMPAEVSRAFEQGLGEELAALGFEAG